MEPGLQKHPERQVLGHVAPNWHCSRQQLLQLEKTSLRPVQITGGGSTGGGRVGQGVERGVVVVVGLLVVVVGLRVGVGGFDVATDGGAKRERERERERERIRPKKFTNLRGF